MIIAFLNSKSKNIKRAINIASNLDYRVIDGVNIVRLSQKDIIEKWQLFNSLFWIVINWKGSYLEIAGNKLYLRKNMTQVFYKVQSARTSLICKLSNLSYLYYLPENIDNDIANAILDQYDTIKKAENRLGEMLKNDNVSI